MGNNMCAGARQGECSRGSDPKTPVAFGMLCGRSYDKPIVIKFHSQDVYTKTATKRRRKSKSNKR